ncbi:phenylacetate--CoA ligase family protein [Noviherbaspirillum saxi]|nr:AMP-binding protein [Noviherbaspirillum saxi]
MSSEMLHPEFETIAPEPLRKLQDALWERQWKYLRAHSSFYQRKLHPLSSAKTIGLDSITLDSLEELPFTDKDELRLSQEADYPFGDYIACPEEEAIRLHRTSGTTGRPLHLANSRADTEWIARIGGRALYASGLRPKDRVVHCLNYCMWTGGVTDHLALEATGACVIPFGVGNSELLLKTIADLKISAISCTPSYPAFLEKMLAATGANPRDLNLRIALFGGEAGLDNQEFRDSMEAKWGFGVRNANYGMSEVLSNFASQCEHTNDLHFHGNDFIFAEILDAKGNRLPIKEGTVGEIVCTHLRKECQPLIRYRTRDVITVTGTDTCGCGRTSWRFRVTGRTDDMFNVRGVNVFPTAVQKAVLSLSDSITGQFRIVLAGPGPYDRIELKVEAGSSIPQSDWPGLGKCIEEAVKDVTGASAMVTVIAPDSLPRTEGKTSLIERKTA